jgi:hypothetical protein
MGGMLELDHVVFAVADLEAAARELEARHGVVSLAGGRHPGWGTANRIVPLGGAYLELVAVVDAAEAAGSAFGRWVAAAASDRLQPTGWAVRTDDLDSVAGRLGLEIAANSRTRPDGSVLRWRLAGAEHAALDPSLPFFIEWDEGVPLPGDGGALMMLRELRLRGEARRLEGWLGPNHLPFRLEAGSPGVTAVVLSGGQRDVVIGV